MKLSLKGRDIPRSKGGDPSFSDITQLQRVFTSEEIVELCNRSLYQLEYQQRSHAKYRQEREELLRPVKQMFKTLYPQQSFAKATDQQLRECVERLKEERQQ